MPPVSRKNSPSPSKRPSPGKRRTAVAGTRLPGADRNNRTSGPSLIKAPPLNEPGEGGQPTEPTTADEAADATQLDILKPDAHEVTRPRRSRLLVAALAVSALMLVAAVVLSVLSFVHARTPEEAAGSTTNVALLDAPATQQVGAAAVDILQKAYSYSYTTIDQNLDEAVAVMTPEMGMQHRANFGTIRKTVTQAKTTTKATVVSDAVRLLDGDRAEVIAFVVVTGDNGGTALQPSGYRFTASLLRTDGKWLLSGLTES